MKYTLIIFFLFLLACNGSQPETVVIEVGDSTQVERIMPSAKYPEQPYIIDKESGDTVFISIKDTTVTKTQSVTVTTTYPVTKITTKPFKGGTIPVDPPPPTGTVKYLSLPAGQSQTYNNRSNLVIENLSFANKNGSFQNGNVLWFNSCTNITIRNCYFGSSAGVAIYAAKSSNILIENCVFAYNKGAVNGSLCTGGIAVVNCEMINGYGSGAPYEGKDGNLFKLTECKGPGYRVENCRVENFNPADAAAQKYIDNKSLLESNPEDLISLYASEGTQASPILIKGNTFRGGGPSKSGGGIVAGDGTNTFTGGWVNILDNILVDPGNYGIAAAGGHDIRIEGNKIFAKQVPWSNNGLFIWNQYSPPCNNVVVRNNRVSWTCGNPANCTPGAQNHSWNAGNCSNTVFEKATPITLAEIGLPAHLFKLISPAELVAIRAAK